MRIKFLSLIASFFMVSFAITSCLGDETEIEYSPDATIHAFELDTIGYGINYKFTIDQQKGEIYNEDSLPVHADTIINKILITTLTTASGVVTMKDQSGNDSILNISDSIDLRRPLKIKVWSTEALAGISATQTKEYTINVRIHQHDPDSLRWEYCNEFDNQLTGEQKSIIFKQELLTYTVVNQQLNVYKSTLAAPSNWQSETVEGLPAGKLPTSILSFQLEDLKKLYATSDNDGKVYESADGINWEVSAAFGEGVDLLLDTLEINGSCRINYTKKDANGQRCFYHRTYESTEEIPDEGENKGIVPAHFPTKNISYTIYKSSTNINSVLLVGDTDDNDTDESTIVWAYDGYKWIELSTTSAIASCPKFTQPSILYYNDSIYLFGQGFSAFYVSSQGLFWKEASNKFAFPRKDWSETGQQTPVVPEFRGRTHYSMAIDYATQKIWILFSKGTATFEESVSNQENTSQTTVHRNYSYGPEVWSGRLNQLWFDLAYAGK